MMSNQSQAVLDYLRKNKTITSMEAITKLGITRLAAKIYALRERGIAIDKETIAVKKGVYVARYSLSAQEGQSDE